MSYGRGCLLRIHLRWNQEGYDVSWELLVARSIESGHLKYLVSRPGYMGTGARPGKLARSKTAVGTGLLLSPLSS